MAKHQQSLPDLFRNPMRGSLREVSRLQRSLDRLWDEFINPEFASQLPLEREGLLSFSPPCDIEETDDHYVLSLDLPGVHKEDIKVEVHDNQLILSGEKRMERRRETGRLLNFERAHGEFHRTFSLPMQVDPDRVEAHFVNGVLHLLLPKSESSRSRLIPIEEKKEGLLGKLLGSKEKEQKEPKEGKGEKVA